MAISRQSPVNTVSLLANPRSIRQIPAVARNHLQSLPNLGGFRKFFDYQDLPETAEICRSLQDPAGVFSRNSLHVKVLPLTEIAFIWTHG